MPGIEQNWYLKIWSDDEWLAGLVVAFSVIRVVID